jgi:hypothetical protein
MNSIRTPKQGKTANSRQIAQAVDDENWQQYRLAMKGQPTRQKIIMLRNYYEAPVHHANADTPEHNCVFCIRVDNYIKALCRGGQLKAGESLQTLRPKWNPEVIK